MISKRISSGTVHKVPADVRKIFSTANKKVLETWEDITPLARNEWLCWIISAKSEETRKQHIERAIADLSKGKRRPCCWMGCVHRTDKPMSASQKYIIGKILKKKS